MIRGVGFVILLAALGAGEIAWAADGTKLFSDRCASCHGPAGKGSASGPALKGDPFVMNGTAAEIKKVIMEGRSVADKKFPNIPMPMPSGMASDSEADALVGYLKADLQK